MDDTTKMSLLTKLAAAVTDGFMDKLEDLKPGMTTEDCAAFALDLKNSASQRLMAEVNLLSDTDARKLLHDFLLELGVKQLDKGIRETLGLGKHKQKDEADGFSC